jgi:hypothetical protein
MGTQGLAELTKLLEGRSRMEVRAICIEALRQWQGDAPGERVIQMHGNFGLYAARLMLKDRSVSVNPNIAKEPFIYNQSDPALAPIMEFIWWLVRAALAIPEFHVLRAAGDVGVSGLGHHAAQVIVSGPVDVLRLRLTDAGVRFLAARDEHPLSPGYLHRLRERHPDVPDEVVFLVEDAQACLEFRLMRPAVVLLGLAYETAVLKVLEKLAEKAIVHKVPENAAKRIGTLRSTLPKLEAVDGERATATAALDFADHLRIRRNDASHPVESWTWSWPFDDSDELEELIISAARHLPFLWGIAGRPLRGP